MLQPQANWLMPGAASPVWAAGPLDTLVPPVNVLESNNDLIYIFTVPGARPEDVRVEVNRQALELEGTVAGLPGGSQYIYRYREWPAGRFYRTLPLPPEIDADKARADFNQGLLTVSFPKTARGRQVAINVTASRREHGDAENEEPGSPARTPLL